LTLVGANFGALRPRENMEPIERDEALDEPAVVLRDRLLGVAGGQSPTIVWAAAVRGQRCWRQARVVGGLSASSWVSWCW